MTILTSLICVNTSGSIETMTEADVFELLIHADDQYYNAEDPIMDDGVYDDIYKQAKSTYPANEYFTGVGSTSRGGKIKLPFTMGSLNQIYLGEYDKWIKDCTAGGEQIVVSDKLDGGSNMMTYRADGSLQIAYSRGDGVEGADITRHISRVHNVPVSISNNNETITVRAEHIVSPTNFELLRAAGIKTSAGKLYKNPRNLVSGLMNASENDDLVYKYIDVVAYEIVGSSLSKREQLDKLKQLGFKVVKYRLVDASALSDATLTDLLNNARAATEYEIDGLVLDIESNNIRKSLVDKNSLNPKYAVKFKVADASNIAQAKVLGVEWNLSKHGYFKPKIKIDPTNLVGVTIQYASGFNAKFINDNNIGPGAIVCITRAGDVVPYVQSVVSPSPSGPQLPDADYVWTDTGVDILLADTTSNDDVKLQKLVDFFTSLDVPKFKDGNLKPFVELGITDIATIIDMTQEDISGVVGSKLIGKDIYSGLRERLTNVPMYVLMGSLTTFGRGVGIRKMKKLWEAFEGDMSKCSSVELIENVESFDTKTANKVVAGYDEFVRFYNAIKHKVTIAPYVAKAAGKLSGSVFVFTGFRNSDLERQVVELGGTMGSGVNSKTSYLVSNEPDSMSGKAKKARDLGVRVISIGELENML